MIFFLNFDGTLTRQDTGRIYQGSTAVPEIKVLSGVSSASSVLEVAFTLPNGLVTQYFPLTQQGEYEQDGIKAFLWSLELATGILSNVTEQVGKVGVSVRQVNVINNTVVASYTATFDVEYSALPYTPTEYTPADTQELIDLLGAYYNQNQVLIDSIKGDYDSVVGRLDEQGEDITNIESDIDKLEELTDKPLLINITTDVETGVGTKYYNDGTIATFEIGTDVATSNRGNFMTEISFLATSLNWTQESDGTYSIVFSPATTERNDANCIVAVDRLDGNGYNQTANGVLKGSDGSLALYGVLTPFDGKLLVLAGGGAGTKIWTLTARVGAEINELVFDTASTPNVYGDFIVGGGNATLIKVGEAKTTLIQDGTEFTTTIDKGLVAQNLDTPPQAELAWFNPNFNEIIINQDENKCYVDGVEYPIEDAGELFTSTETIVYRQYSEFWQNNGKPTGWLVDGLTFDKTYIIEEVNNYDKWEDYVGVSDKSTLYNKALIGDYYVDKATGKWYVCVGKTDTSIDWSYLFTGMVSVNLNGTQTSEPMFFAPTSTRSANTDGSCWVLTPNGYNAPEWGQMTLETADNLTYTIKIGGKSAGSFTLTKEVFLDSVSYNPETKKLTFTYNTESGKASVDIDLSDLAGGNVALPSTGTTTISSSSFSITPTGWIATAYVANYTAGTSILISPNTISDYNTCQKIGVYYATKAIGDANTIQFYAKNQPNTGLNETITFAYTLIPANSATQAGAVVFDGATGVAKTTNITVTSTAWVQDDNGDYYWGNYCERTDLNIFKPANVYSQDTLISCGASGMYELPNTAGSTSSKMVIKVKTPPTTDIFIDKVTFNIGHPNTAMPCAILNLPSASGGSGGTSAKTGQVTVEASDWVAGDAFGAYRAIITLPTQMDYADTVLLSRTTVSDPHITFAGKWSTDTPTVRISALKAENVTFTWTVIPASATGATQGAVIVSAISQDEILKVDWATLKDMRDNGKLAQGKQYRITDYACTTTQDNTQSAGHPFDIIVVADSPNTLNENARAVAHEGDTYFANCKLSAWEIKYCLDNDATRFEWAQPYIPAGIAWFTSSDYDIGVWNATGETYEHGGVTYYVFYNEEADSTFYSAVPNPTSANANEVYIDLDENITLEDDGMSIDTYGVSSERASGKGVIYYMKDELANECPYDFKNILYDREGIKYYTFSREDDNGFVIDASFSRSRNNKILPYNTNEVVQLLNDIVFKGECENNTFGNGCYYNTFGVLCGNNTFGDDCYNNTFDINCSRNTFGNSCRGNTFGYNCNGNTLGNGCDSNTFGFNCYNNTFGNSCWGNTFGDNYSRNIVDNGVEYAQPQSTTGTRTVQGIHIHYGVTGQFTVVRGADYTQDVRTTNDVTIEV